MFIYSFKTPGNFLITHVVVSGQHLTFYCNKSSSAELLPLINHFNLTGIQFAEHPIHRFLHHPFVEFSKQGDNIPHKHLKFHSENRFEALTEICQFLLDRQSNFNLRKDDFLDLYRGLDAGRQSYGHKELPKEIQQTLLEYDYETPYFPAEEVAVLLNEFSHFLQSDGMLKKSENLAVYAEKVLKNNWSFLHEKLMHGEPETKQEIELKNFYDYLCGLRYFLLKINDKNQIEDYANAHHFAHLILKNPCVNSRNTTGEDLYPLQLDIKKIVELTAGKLKRNDRKISFYLAGMAMVGVGLSELYLYYRFSSASNKLTLPHIAGEVLAIGTLVYVINKPLSKLSFFATNAIDNVKNYCKSKNTNNNSNAVFIDLGTLHQLSANEAKESKDNDNKDRCSTSPWRSVHT